MLNYEEIKKDARRITKFKTLMNKCKWEGINFSLEKDDWNKFEKNNVAIALNVLYAKKEKYILLMFQNITQIVKTSYSFNDFKRRKRMALSCSKGTISNIKRNNF